MHLKYGRPAFPLRLLVRVTSFTVGSEQPEQVGG